MTNYENFNAFFHTVMALNGFSRFSDESYAKPFFDLTERMLTVNESMNLTAIKEASEIILLHYADSLTAEPFLPQNARVADIGCGAGFPCLPLAICRPDLSILALDSTEKRIKYVKETAELLGCKGLNAIPMRAEEGGRGVYRDSFDVCTARAVAALPLLSELCLPYVRVGGAFLAMKGKRGEEELKASTSAIRKLGGEVARVHSITLHRPIPRDGTEEETRCLIEIKKIKPTPVEYPRAWAKILKRPL